jgi:FkbM family methyltransferase
LRLDLDGGRHRLFACVDTEHVKTHTLNVLSNKVYKVYGFFADRTTRVFDIGANIGAATVFFHFAFPRARIYAYEPASRAFAFLKENVGDLPRAKVLNCGLLDRDCMLDLKVGGDVGEVSTVLSSGPAAASGRVERVEMREAAKEIAKWSHARDLAVLKIDTEGCEVPILRNVEKLFDRVGVVYVEYHSEADRRAIDAIMAKGGFCLYTARADFIHRGEFTYVRSDIVASMPRHARWEIRSVE